MYVLLLEVVALVGATVHTMEPATAPLEGATVLIEDGLVLEVGMDVIIPEDATTIDLPGLHLIPGLLDASVTFDADHDSLYLSAGVTVARDSGSPIGSMLPEASAGMRDRHPGPDLLVPSPVFSSPMTATRGDAFLLDEPQKAAEQIAELVALIQSANAGIDSLLKNGQRFETIETDEAFESWMASQVMILSAGDWRVTPFLMGTARILRMGALEEPPAALAAIGGVFRTAWRTDMETFQLLRAGDALGPVELSLERQRRFTKALYEAGVQLVPGSGAPSGGIAPGSGLVDELEEWSQAGVPAGAILELATIRAAEALGVSDRLGKISPGLQANLMACGSDPRRSVDALRKPELVVVRGRVLERFHLDDAVNALVERQDHIEAQRSRPIALPRPMMPEGKVLVEGTANLMAYGTRTAIERYSVVELPNGGMVYGARVLVLATGMSKARELQIIQVIRNGLVEMFDLTLAQLDESGEAEVTEDGAPAFVAQGRLAVATKRLVISRFRDGIPIDAKATEEAIAAVDGSSVLVGLIGARHFPEGNSFVAAFDGVAMEPIVSQVKMSVSAEDGRLAMDDPRGARVFGFGPGAKLRFAARAKAGGRLDLEPGTALGDDAVSVLEIPEARQFKGDASTWFQTGANAAKSPAKSAVEASGEAKKEPSSEGNGK